jgi:hypothetical protein
MAKQGLISPEQYSQIAAQYVSPAPSDVAQAPSEAPQQYAQSSPYQMRPIGGGQVQVINVRTGQVVYTGSASGASNAQATATRRIIE